MTRPGLLILSLFSVAIGSAPATSQPYPETFTLSGVVIDEDTGEGVRAVAIHVSGMELGTVTDREGRYAIRGVPNRNMTVVARRTGYITERRELWVCTPILHPRGRCLPPPAEDRQLRFFLRAAPPPRHALELIAPSPNR